MSDFFFFFFKNQCIFLQVIVLTMASENECNLLKERLKNDATLTELNLESEDNYKEKKETYNKK